MSINTSFQLPSTTTYSALTQASMNDLPRDVLGYIFAKTHFSPNLSLVCKAWRKLSHESRTKHSLSNLVETAKLAQNLYINFQKLSSNAIRFRVEILLECLTSKPGPEVLSIISKMAIEWKKLDRSVGLNQPVKTSHLLAQLHYNTPKTPKTVQLALASLTSDSNTLENCALSSEPAYNGLQTKSTFDSSKLNYASIDRVNDVHISPSNTFETNEIVIIQLNHIAVRTKDFVFGKILAQVGDTYEIQVKEGMEQFATPVMIGKLAVKQSAQQ